MWTSRGIAPRHCHPHWPPGTTTLGRGRWWGGSTNPTISALTTRCGRRRGEWGQGQLGWGGGHMGHNNNNNRNNDDDTHARNNHIINIIAHHMPKILILASCCGSHVTAHESMEYWLDNHRLDVLPCGENGPGGVTRPLPPYGPYSSLEAHNTWMRPVILIPKAT